MSHIITLVFILLLSLSLAGCDADPPKPADEPSESVVSEPVELPPIPALPPLPDVPAAPEPLPVGVFADPQVEESVRVFAKKAEGELTQEDLDSVTRVVINGVPVADLNGLQNCRNLKELYLCDNGNPDLSVLQACKSIKKLTLQGMHLDLSVLQSMTQLEYLDIGGGEHTDLSALQTLTNLESLYLNGNPVSDLSPLQNLTSLKYLELYQCENIDFDILVAVERRIPDLHVEIYEWGV